MFTISPTLLQQCIDMVAKEQGYIPFPDGIEADYSVYNIPGEGVWIVDPWVTVDADYTKVQKIVLPEQKAVGLFYVVCIILYGNRLQQCGNSCYYSREEAEAIYTACSEHVPVVMYSYVYGGVMHEVKRNY